ncbi:VOC family protein [Microbacterium lacusdiani]|jgi:catechol 2,3-dioxygenase-like lactoylglutathione lyase family enzyme
MLIVGSIVIRVRDIAVQTEFWTRVLDYEVCDPSDDDFVVLIPRRGAGPNVSLDAAPSERVLAPRTHLDLYAEDQSAEVRRLIGLGASEVRWSKRPADADYVILEAPEGNRFCVIDAAGWHGWAAHRER